MQIKTVKYPFLFLFLIGLIPSYAFGFQDTEILDSPADTVTQSSKGVLKVIAEADTVYLYLNENYRELITLTDEKEIDLDAGYHLATLFSRVHPEMTFNIEIKENEIIEFQLPIPDRISSYDNAFSMYAAIHWDANLMVFTDDETLITILGENIEAFGFLKAKVRPGVYRIIFENPEGRREEKFITVNTHRLTTVEDYLRPIKSRVFLPAAFPGGAQFYKRDFIKGAFFTAFTGFAFYSYLDNQRKLTSGIRDFNNLLDRYNNTTNEYYAFLWGNHLDDMSGNLDKFELKRNVYLTASILLYSWSIYDALRPPKNGYAELKKFDPFRDFSFEIRDGNTQLKLTINF